MVLISVFSCVIHKFVQGGPNNYEINYQFVHCCFFTQLGTLVATTEYLFVDRNGWLVQIGDQEEKLTVLDLVENRSLRLVTKVSNKT